MENNEFKQLLFKVAFCTMVCDGRIDGREIDEIKMMDKNTIFFRDIDLSEELSELLGELSKKGTQVINDLFKSLKESNLNTMQGLIVLEVALRIISADDIHDETEVKYVNLLRAQLKLHDEEIVDRFGDIDILHTSSHLKNVVKGQFDKDFTRSIRLPKLNEFSELEINLK